MWVVMGLRITYPPWGTGSEAHRFLQNEKGGRESESVSRAMPVVSELSEGSTEGLTQPPVPSAWNNRTILHLPNVSRQP